jgi:hypothetical protein
MRRAEHLATLFRDSDDCALVAIKIYSLENNATTTHTMVLAVPPPLAPGSPSPIASNRTCFVRIFAFAAKDTGGVH